MRCWGVVWSQNFDRKGYQGHGDEAEADTEVEELHDSGGAWGRPDGEDLDEFEGHDDSAGERGTKGAETAAANEERRSEHGAAADEKKQREARNGEVGEDGALELFDRRRVEPDEKGDAAGHG